MGCAGSTHKFIMSGAHQGSCLIKTEDGQLHTCEYAGCTLPRKGKNQDRFGIRFDAGALIVGIFDGHSVHDASSGIRHAERACIHLTNGLYPQCAGALRKTKGCDLSADLTSKVVGCFHSYQQQAGAHYEEVVVKTLLAKKAELEKEIGEEIPMELPQEGGTTATVMVVHPNGVMTAWVGDSRAVAGVKEEGGEWRAEALSVDHSINDPKERERVLAAGGQTAAKEGEGKLSEMVCVPKAEGSLKVTRSLGDVPHHANDAVSHVPDISHRQLSHGLRFVMACSDGVWDELDDATAVKLVGDHLDASTGDKNAAGSACDAVVEAVKAKSDHGEPNDDVSVVIVTMRLAKQ